MSNLKQHKQALFCNDNEAINDYETAMNNAVQAVSAWLKNEKNVHRRFNQTNASLNKRF